MCAHVHTLPYLHFYLTRREGEEWKQLRGSLSKPLAPRKLTLFIDDLSSVAEEFISVVQSSSSSDEEGFLRDVLPFLQRWAMEGLHCNESQHEMI